jgi:ribosomal protein S12 methylthiotransferase
MINRTRNKIITSTSSDTSVRRNQTIGILSLGCPRNLVDSESILGRLAIKGYSIVDMDKADVAIVNTCAFIEDARTESVDAILDLIDCLRMFGRAL